MSKNALQSVVGGLGAFYEWVADRLGDDAARSEILIDLGLPPTLAVGAALPQSKIKGINEYRKSINIENDAPAAMARDVGALLGLPVNRSAKLVLPQKSLDGIAAFVAADDPGASEYGKALDDLKAMYEAISSFVQALGGSLPDDKGEVTARLLRFLISDYFRLHLPLVYWFAQPFGLLEDLVLSPEVQEPFRLNFGGGWKIDDDAAALRMADRFFMPVAVASMILVKHFVKPTVSADGNTETSFVLEPFYGWDGSPGSTTPLSDAAVEGMLTLRLTRGKTTLTAGKLDETAENATMTFCFVPSTRGGPGLFISVGGGYSLDVALSPSWRLKIEPALSGLMTFFIHLNSFSKSSAAGPTTASRPSFKVTLDGASADAPLFRLGGEDGTHVELGQLVIEAELSPDVAGLKAITRKSELVIDLGKSGDGFLGDILPGTKRVPLNFGFGYTADRGLFFDLDPDRGSLAEKSAPGPQLTEGFEAAAPASEPSSSEISRLTPVGQSFAGVRIQLLKLQLTPQSLTTVKLAAKVTLDATIGPVTAAFDEVGFGLTLDLGKPKPNLSLFDLAFGFEAPARVGLGIDAKVVRGGGFLGHDVAKAEYSGLVYLEVSGGITLTALGLLNTRLPDGSKGYSLLVIITAQGFQPIPLGFGFMLSGIGGMVGIHRTASVPALQAAVLGGGLEAVLSPKDPIRNAVQYLNTLSTFFPPARDHFLVGISAQITWGTPVLVTINLALIFEFGKRTRLLLLGQLTAILPKPELDLVRLQMNIVGGIDFDRQEAFLDAALFDSRLVKKFVITGEMRMRLNWGQKPAFALAIGGVHPAFTPPAGLEKMQRAAIVFSDTENFKLRCESYFAITSNTIQFGANAELFAKSGRFSVSGSAGYDVLIQLSPFHFVASVHASFQLKMGSRNLFRVSFTGELSGPRPLHIQGKATFEIFWCDFSVSFDTTLVSGEKPPLPPATNVEALLRQALADPASWSTGSGENTVTLRSTTPSGTIRLHPSGTLSIKQSVVPLNLRIERFGATRPEGGPQEFRLLRVQVGAQILNTEPIRDQFAPAQFLDLTDAQKLSSPSFEALQAGVEAGAGPAVCGAAVSVEAAFEETIIADQPPARQTGSADLGAHQRMALWSAAGSSEVRRVGTTRYKAPAVADFAPVKTFTLDTGSTLVFATRVEALQAAKKVKGSRIVVQGGKPNGR